MAALYRVAGFDEAVALVNDSPYGLTAAIHTASVHRAMRFAERVAAGVVVVNAGTHGSEPHMGFGGVKQSGTGWKEAGLESLDVYSETQYVNLVVDPGLDVTQPIAVLGLGGIGGMLAVRTGAALRRYRADGRRDPASGGCGSSTGDDDRRASRGRRRGSRLRWRCSSWRSRRTTSTAALDRVAPEALAGAVDPPAPERPRARRGDPSAAPRERHSRGSREHRARRGALADAWVAASVDRTTCP